MQRLAIMLGGPMPGTTHLKFHYQGLEYNASMDALVTLDRKVLRSRGMLQCYDLQPARRGEMHPIGLLDMNLMLFDGSNFDQEEPMFMRIDKPMKMTPRDAFHYGAICTSGKVSGERFNRPFPDLPEELGEYLSCAGLSGFRAFGIQSSAPWVRIVFSNSGTRHKDWFRELQQAFKLLSGCTDKGPLRVTPISEIGKAQWFGLSIIPFSYPHIRPDGCMHFPVGLRRLSLPEMQKASDWLWRPEQRRAILATGNTSHSKIAA